MLQLNKPKRIYCQGLINIEPTVPEVDQLIIGGNWLLTWWNTSTSAAHEINQHKWTLSTKTFQMWWSFVWNHLRTIQTSVFDKNESTDTRASGSSFSLTELRSKKINKIKSQTRTVCTTCRKLLNVPHCHKLHIACVNMPMCCTFTIAESKVEADWCENPFKNVFFCFV